MAVKVHSNENFVLFRHHATEKYALESPAIYSMVPVERPGIGTLCVDKYYRVYYDPAWLQLLVSNKEYRGKLWKRCPDRHELPDTIPAFGPNGAGSYCITHECDHLLGNHHIRAEAMGITSENAELFNIAWDIVIEWQKRKDYGYIFIGGAHAEGFNVDGNLPGEAVYLILKQRQDNGEDIRTGEPKEDDGDDGAMTDPAPRDDGDTSGPPPNAPSSDSESNDDASDGTDGASGTGDDDTDDTDEPTESLGNPVDDAELEEQQWEEQSPLTSGSCADGQQKPWELPAPEDCNTEGADEVEHEQLMREVAENIREEAEHGIGAGGSKLDWANQVLRSNVDVAGIVQRFVRTGIARAAGGGGRTWRRTKRYKPHPDVEMPQSRRLVANVVVIVDTSYSMCDNQNAGLAIGAVERLLRGFQQRGKVTVVTGDTEVSTVNLATRIQDVMLEGGGGTDMGALVTSASEMRPKPDAIVVITDGYTGWCDRVSIPVFAVLTQPVTGSYPVAPWIRHINISPEAINV